MPLRLLLRAPLAALFICCALPCTAAPRASNDATRTAPSQERPATYADFALRVRAVGLGQFVRIGGRFYRRVAAARPTPRALGPFAARGGAAVRGTTAQRLQFVELPPPSASAAWLPGMGFPCGTSVCSIAWPLYTVKKLIQPAIFYCAGTRAECPQPGDYYWEVPDDPCTSVPGGPPVPSYCAFAGPRSTHFAWRSGWVLDHLETSADCGAFAIDAPATAATELTITITPPADPNAGAWPGYAQETTPQTNPPLTCAIKVFIAGTKGTPWHL